MTVDGSAALVIVYVDVIVAKVRGQWGTGCDLATKNLPVTRSVLVSTTGSGLIVIVVGTSCWDVTVLM